MDSSIAILCRGKSLKYVGELPAVEQYIIVNRFGDELSDDTLANVLMNKKINQVLTLVPDEPTLMIQRGYYEKFKIEKLILPYLNETLPGRHPKIKGYGNQFIRTETLSNDHKKFMFKRGERPDGDTRYSYSYPTAGLAALVHGTIDYDKKNIFVIGLDFYQANYAFASEFINDEQALRRGENPNMMRDFLTNFLMLKNKKKFTIITSSDYKCDANHVEIINKP